MTLGMLCAFERKFLADEDEILRCAQDDTGMLCAFERKFLADEDEILRCAQDDTR